jgi:hypothetical protein
MLRQIAPMLVNAMFYLENPISKPTPRPSRGTPAPWVHEWDHGAQNKRHSLAKKISSQGHTIVHFLCLPEGLDVKHKPSHATDSSTKSAHWRRGHWREQAHGPNLSLRKRVLIKPVMVNAHGMNPVDVPGHLYVSSDEKEQIDRARVARDSINKFSHNQKHGPHGPI